MRNLNVYEEFEFDEEKDMTHVRDEILKQTSIETFKSVPIKEALESLSSFNINKDLSPDVITSDLRRLLKIVKHGKIEHIKIEHDEINKLMKQIREIVAVVVVLVWVSWELVARVKKRKRL